MRISQKKMNEIREANRARAKLAWTTPTPVRADRAAPERDYQATVASRPSALVEVPWTGEALCEYAPKTEALCEYAPKTPEQTLDFSQYFFSDLEASGACFPGTFTPITLPNKARKP